MVHRSHTHRAFVTLELTVSIVLTGVLLGGISTLAIGYAKASDYFITHRQVQLAAESVLERFRANPATIVEGDSSDDATGIEYTVTIADGRQQWTGLSLVTVEARTTARHRRHVSFTIRSYFARSDP
jgi:hypothetical protein